MSTDIRTAVAMVHGKGNRSIGAGVGTWDTSKATLFYWRAGERNRPLDLRRPCACGCDARDGHSGVGYLTASDGDGNGFTMWLHDEATYQIVGSALLAFAKSIMPARFGV